MGPALIAYGTKQQQDEFLPNMLAGKTTWCIGMSEPNAGSDLASLKTFAADDGDEWVINGEKYYISNAGDPRCKIMITMVKTSPDAPTHLQQSQILVPMDTPGVKVIGPMHVFGADHAPRGHMHIKFTNVRVPKENILLGEGRGFEIAQGRLGPGRIHHCMRVIGRAVREAETDVFWRAGSDLDMLPAIKAFAVEAHHRSKYHQAIETARMLNLGQARLSAFVGPLVALVAGLAAITILLVGSEQVAAGTRTPGELFAFLLYKSRLFTLRTVLKALSRTVGVSTAPVSSCASRMAHSKGDSPRCCSSLPPGGLQRK